jgi:hypothetical protein
LVERDDLALSLVKCLSEFTYFVIVAVAVVGESVSDARESVMIP